MGMPCEDRNERTRGGGFPVAAMNAPLPQSRRLAASCGREVSAVDYAASRAFRVALRGIQLAEGKSLGLPSRLCCPCFWRAFEARLGRLSQRPILGCEFQIGKAPDSSRMAARFSGDSTPPHSTGAGDTESVRVGEVDARRSWASFNRAINSHLR